MNTVVPIRKTYYRLMLRVRRNLTIRYRTKIVPCTTDDPSFSYEILAALFNIKKPDEWLASGLEKYPDAFAELKQKASTYGDEVRSGFFVSMNIATRELTVGGFEKPKS